MISNAERIERAQQAVEAYPTQEEIQDEQTTLNDLLSDLRHWAADLGLNFESALLISEINFEEEGEA